MGCAPAKAGIGSRVPVGRHCGHHCGVDAATMLRACPLHGADGVWECVGADLGGQRGQMRAQY